MRKFIVLALYMGLAWAAFAQNPLNNKSVPEVTLRDLEGNLIELSTQIEPGQITVLSFWAIWCIPCLKELDNMSLLYEDWQEAYGVQILAISTDDARTSPKVRSRVVSNDWPFKVLLDPNGDMKRLLGFQLIPHTVLLDAEGKISYVHSGYVEGDEFVLEEKIIELSGN